MSRALIVASLFVLATACGGSDGDPIGADESATTVDGWESLGVGVSYKNTGAGDGIWIGYAGYSVADAWSCAWTEELSRTKLKELGIGHLYAVRGPSDAGYGRREIANRKLGAHLLGGPAANAPFIFVAAHSSGSYVAHEMLGQLAAAGSDASKSALRKIVYANLDGGDAGLTPALVRQLGRVAFVWAEDTTLAAGRSANAQEMQTLGRTYGNTNLRIVSDGTGCNSGARWCLHDALITTRPHDPARYDLRHDYTDFASRPVQTAWIDSLASSLQ